MNYTIIKINFSRGGRRGRGRVLGGRGLSSRGLGAFRATS